MIKNIYFSVLRIAETGCREEYPPALIRNIQLTNYSVIIASVSAFLFNLMTYVWVGSDSLLTSLTLVLFILSFWFSYYLNSRYRHFYASLSLNLFITASVATQIFIIQIPVPGLKYYFFLFSVIPLITIPLHRIFIIIFLSFMNIALYLYASYAEIHFPPEYPYDRTTVFFINSISATGVIITIITVYALNQILFNRIENRLQIESEINRKAAESLRIAHEEQSALAAELSELSRQLLEKNENLKNLAIRDPLTGLYNRYYFDEALHDAVQRTWRYPEPISLIIIDIDYFKKINDTYGHDQGDIILSETASLIRECVRKADVCARWGGEEFTILLPQTNLEGAFAAAEKIRKKTEEHNFSIPEKITISLGVAEKLREESTEEWFRRADQALYHSKQNGRNRTTAARPAA